MTRVVIQTNVFGPELTLAHVRSFVESCESQRIPDDAVITAEPRGPWRWIARRRPVLSLVANSSRVAPERCGAELDDDGKLRVCKFPRDHDGDWHDDGAMCWPVEREALR